MSAEIKNSTWKELFENQNSQNAKNNPVIQQIDSYYFIYDCHTNQVSFINSAFETVTGYDPKTFTIEQLIEMIHPDDLSYFFDCESKGLQFTNSLAFNEHFNYLMSYSFRIKSAHGQYKWIRQQCQALEVNNQGHLSKNLVIHQSIADTNFVRAVNDHRIFDKSRNIYLDAENCYHLTKRELEILRLVQEGVSSLEISNRLFTSKHTVDTHRKNILKKTNSNNFIELIQKLSLSRN